MTVGTEQLTVSWEAVEGAQGYHVYLAGAAGITVEDIDTMPGGRVETVTDATDLAIEDLEPGTAWCARVDAFDKKRQSVLSEEVAGLLPPAAPAGLAATPADEAIRLEWSPAPGATAYDVYLAASGDLDSQAWATLPRGQCLTEVSSPLDLTGLEPGVELFFRVVARNDSGPSPDSALVSAIPKAPMMVGDLSGEEGPGEVTITWSDVYEGAVYVLYIATEPGVTSENWESLEGGRRYDHATSPFVVADLEAGTTVYFVVTVMEDGGEGPDSPEVCATANGRGTFSVGVAVSVGTEPTDLVVADLDGDGAADVVTANLAEGTISILAGAGDGTFDDAETVAVGAGPCSIEAGDVDGDGNLDLVVSLAEDGAVVVLSGDGALGFEESLRIEPSDLPGRICLADVDDDGAVDLLVGLAGGSEIEVWIGDGEGSFDLIDSVEVGDRPAGMALADLDGDGALDLVVAIQGDSSVAVLTGQGDGTFSVSATIQTAPDPVEVVVSDLDADGAPEITVIATAVGFVECFTPDGAGGYASLMAAPAGMKPLGCGTGDFDGDGRGDLLVLDGAEGSIAVLRGDPVYVLKTRQRLDGLENRGGRVWVQDLDGDGLPDAAYASATTDTVQILLGNP
jgi:hypothetical protein